MYGKPSFEAGPHEACATLTIDLKALVANWGQLSGIAAPAECAAAVKADAYGLGVAKVAPALARAGCRTFFVAHASEGRQLREVLGEDRTGFKIYVLNGLPGGHGGELAQHGLRPVLNSLEEIKAWRACSDSLGAGLPAALHVDTGMHRLGLPPGQLAAARSMIAEKPYLADDPEPRFGTVVPLAVATRPATKVAAQRKMAPGNPQPMPPGVYIDLVMSHFVSSERADDPLNWRQMSAFRKIAQEFPGIPASLANSSGIFLPQHPLHDIVRPGYAMYGGNPTPGKPNPMQPVVRLQAAVIQLRDIKAGESAGYNSLWTARRDSRLATIGIGYADGFPRNAGNIDGRATPGAEAIVAGRRCPFVGRTSMDLAILDVTEVPEAATGGRMIAEVLGRDITVDDLAARSGAIGYEILTGLGRRFHRDYVGGAGHGIEAGAHLG